jgi:hypothetical protein
VDTGEEPFIFLDQVDDTAGSYLDKKSDLQLEGGSIYEDEVNWPPPDRLRLLVPWVQANRLIGVSVDNPSVLYYTDLTLGLLKPEAWPPENTVYVARDSGDEIVGLFPFTDSVLIFGRRSIFRLRGIPPDDIVLDAVQYEDDMRTAIGTLAQKALVQVDDALINPYFDGAYAISRFVDTEGGFSSNRLSRPIDDLWMEMTPGLSQWSHGIFLRSRKQVRLWLPVGGVLPLRALVYQLDVGATENAPAGWTMWEIGAPVSGSFATVTASVIVEHLTRDAVYIGTVDGYVGEMDQGINDWWYDPPGAGDVEQGRTYPFVYQSVPTYLAEDNRPTRLRFVDVVWGADMDLILICTPITGFGVDWTSIFFNMRTAGAFILDVSQLDKDRLSPDTFRAEMRGSVLTNGALHAIKWRVDSDARFHIEKFRLVWQPLAQKSRMVDATQALPPFEEPVGFGGEGVWGFGEVPLVAGLAHAACDPALRATVTPRLKFPRPTTKMCDWDIPIQQTFDMLDAAVAMSTYPQTWTAPQIFNAPVVVQGQPVPLPALRLGSLYFDLGTTSVATTDTWTFRLDPYDATIRRIECEAYTGTSFTIQVCKDEDPSCIVNLSGTLVCDAAGAFTTTITGADVLAREKVTILVTAVSGTVTKGEIYIEGTAR